MSDTTVKVSLHVYVTLEIPPGDDPQYAVSDLEEYIAEMVSMDYQPHDIEVEVIDVLVD